MQVAVVDDPPLAEAVRRLRGEWNALTGARFDVFETGEAEVTVGEPPAADIVVFPSYLLGPLVEREQLAPWSVEALSAGDLDWPDVFELLRRRGVTWGETVYAVPLGCPTLVCMYRADLLARLDRRPPRTWEEYQDLAALLADRARLGDAAPADDAAWYGTVEPLAPGWASITLLARAAGYAQHPDYYSTLFNIETMEPLIAGAPFVRALEELAAAAMFAPSEQAGYDPQQVRDAFWQGTCAMALTWPTAADAEKPATDDERAPAEIVSVGFAELPGSSEVYHPEDRAWQRRPRGEPHRVPLLSISGQLVAVCHESHQQDAARRLVALIVGRRWGAEVASQSSATTIYRRSQTAQPAMWLEPWVDSQAAQQYGEVAAQIFARQEALRAMPLDGRAAYLAALDTAVDDVLARQQTPEEALAATADRWREITEQLGAEQQRRQYLLSVGLSP